MSDFEFGTKWIPYDGFRLPPKSGSYLVSLDNGIVTIKGYDYESKTWISHLLKAKVKAWMHLPNVYKEN